MKKYLFTAILLLLFLVGNTTSSLGSFLDLDGGIVISISPKNGSNHQTSLIIPDFYLANNNQTFIFPLKVTIATSNGQIYSTTTSKNFVFIPDLEIIKNNTYKITLEIGEFKIVENIIW